MKKSLAKIITERWGICVMLTLLFLLIGGCTEYERAGYSPIPQNTPCGWEINPYGDLRN